MAGYECTEDVPPDETTAGICQRQNPGVSAAVKSIASKKSAIAEAAVSDGSGGRTGTADAGIFAEKTTSVGNVCSQAGWMFAAEKLQARMLFKQDGWKTDSVRDASAGDDTIQAQLLDGKITAIVCRTEENGVV